MARPAKRRASSTLHTKNRMSIATPIYSAVEPTLEEKQLLPERFRKADEWPVTEIIAEKAGKYLVEWEPHPNTGAVWKPEWRKAAHVSNDLIARWREQKRRDKSPRQISTGVSSGLKQLSEELKEGPSKRRRLTRRVASPETSVRTAEQDSIRSESPQIPITRRRRSRLVILSSPTAEIPETREQSLSTTDSIQVNVPQAKHIIREEYPSVPNSSASFEPPGSDPVSSTFTKDQEADSALGLSSPIGEGFARATASSVDQEDEAPGRTRGRLSTGSTSRIPASSIQSVESQNLKEDLRSTSGQVTNFPLQTSDPVKGTPKSIGFSEADGFVHSGTATTSSSPLFYPDIREDPRETDTDAILLLTPSQGLAQSQPVDTSSQQPELGKITAQTHSDLAPISTPLNRRQNTQDLQTQRLIPRVFATPSPVVGHPSTPRTSSQNQGVVTRGLRASTPHLPSSSREPTIFPIVPQRSPPTGQLPRAKLFQRLNLSNGLQQRTESFAEMSSRSRESSPRVRRSAPPVERAVPSSSLRETLIKQTAPARALQQARHERAAIRSTSRATSSATDSTRNSIPARTADASPTRPQTMASSSLSSEQAASANGAFSSSMQVDESEPALVSSLTPANSIYNSALGSSALPLHPSIEDEQSLPEITRPSLPSSPILGPGEYVVPLPAEGKIKDHYLECIRGKRRSLMKFTRNPKSTGRANMSRSSADEAEQMRRLITQLNDTTTHLDLGLDGPATHYTDNSVNEATWTYYASSKFAFLYHLIESLRYRDYCITIVAKEGLTLDLLEKYMKANHVNYQRPQGSDAASTYETGGFTGQIRIDLIASGSDMEKWITCRPSLIMAFDTSFDAQDAQVRRIREQCVSGGSIIPIIYPMIINSAEHVDICIPKSMPSPQRFQMVVQTTFRARESLGGDPLIITSPAPSDSPSSMMNAFIALKKSLGKRFNLIAQAVAHAAISEDFHSNWVLPAAALELEPLSDPSSGLDTATSTSPKSRAGTPSVQKRLLERDSASSISSKRQRRTPALDATHIDDSVKDFESQIEHLRAPLRTAEQKLAEEKKARTAAEELLASKTTQLEVIRLSLGDLQTRYESRMKLSHKLRKENQKLQTEKESIEKRHEKLSADNTAVKEQYAQLRVELQEVREALKAGGGAIADTEIAKEEVRRLAERNLSLEKSYGNMRKDFEFTRSQYQEASTAAAESANHVKELEAQNTELKREASNEKRRLKEVNYKTDLEQHLARVLELELVLKNRDTMLQRKEEELKAMKKGRGVATRGSSVQPGSPRPTGSRGASPAPGLLPPGTHTANRASALRHER